MNEPPAGDPHEAGRYEAGRYEVRLEGHLDDRWSAWFAGLALSRDLDGTTVIEGPVADQAALHDLLCKLRDLGLPLVSVTSVGAENHVGAEDDGPTPGRG